MQVNAVANSLNNSPRFKGSAYAGIFDDYDTRREAFEQAIHKIEQDVSPLTVAVTSFATVAAFLKGKDTIVPFFRKTSVKAFDCISSALVKAVSCITNTIGSKIFKKDGIVNSGKIIQNIENVSKKLYANDSKVYESTSEALGENGSKLLKGIYKLTKDIIGEDNSLKLVEAFNKRNITNGVKAFDAFVAASVVVPFADKVSDKVESKCDDSKFERVKNAFADVIDIAYREVG